APIRGGHRRRCAIYTRKSAEEGLEQQFNSLHAQREACEAFITSQRHEGWACLPKDYMTARFVARINSRAKSAPRICIYERRRYSGRPSSSMRFGEATAMATSVFCRPSVRERSASPITRLWRPISASTKARQL